MATYDYDVIVIGSGAGGSIAAQQLAKKGKSVALVEAGKLGGYTSRYGGIPLQAVRYAASVYEAAKHGGKYGVRGTTVGYNYPTIKSWKDLVVKRTGVHTSEQHFLDLGINVIQGRAYFIDPHTVSVGNARFTGREFLIATGSELSLPEIPGLVDAGFLTPKEALELTRPPKSIAILAGSAAAYELAQLFATFGTKVYFIENAPSLLSQEEAEVSETIGELFSVGYSMSIVLNGTIEAVQKVGASKKVSVLSNGKSQTILVDEVLIASARKAALDIGLENAGVAYKDYAILTDDKLQTSASHIFAAGSCTGQRGTPTHVAAYQSQIAAYNLSHNRAVYADYRAVPEIIYTTPEVARVGATTSELTKRRVGYKTVTVPLSLVSKANTSDFSDGFVKLIASTKTGTLLGGTVVCPNASEAIQELTLAVQNYLSATQVAQTLHVFSSWSEAIRVAAAKLAKLN